MVCNFGAFFPLDWSTGQTVCSFAPGYSMTTVNDDAENAFLDAVGGSARLWIGYTDQAVEGSFFWVDGTLPGYENWNSGEPNNAGNEDCVEMLPSGLWNDMPCGATLDGVICEANSP